MKIFISQPMNGKTDKEIEKEREHIIASAKKRYGENAEIIDSFFKDAPYEAKPLWYLAKSPELLSTADVAYFAKDWEMARGCRIEHTCSLEYGIETVECYNY